MLRTALLALALSAALPVQAAPDDLSRAVRAALDGDRSGACFAVARIDGDRVERAFECADASARRIGPASAFEIGSVTKPMLAALLALHIDAGRASLDDPLSKHLPGVRVPEFEGQSIRLRHLVTHTSGLPALPPGYTPRDAGDPYAGLTPDALLAALPKTTLAQAPGTHFAYSNFAMMLLSQVVTNLGDADVETQLRARLFAPAGMRTAYVATVPDGVRAAAGHASTARPVAQWTFHPALSGVGGAHATLDDMVRYVQAHIAGTGDAALDRALRATLEPVTTPATPGTVGMNWMLQPWQGGTLVAHEGGTGGFSSLVAFAPAQRRGVVILSDTSVNALGGLGALGLHLLDAKQPAPKPRRTVAASAALLDALEGRYLLDAGLGMRLWRKGDALWAQADGQSAFELRYDDAGDFHPREVDALLVPQRQPDGRYAFSWRQGGGVMQARRVDASSKDAAPRIELTPAQLAEYVGTYPLAPGFALTITVKDGRLFGQGTGQSAIATEAVRRDVFAAAQVGAELHFERDAAGRVVALVLRQGGQALRGERTP